MGHEDLELLERYASGGDAEAFAELVTRHRNMVYAACRRVLGSRTDAEDVAQECFLRLARSAGAVRTSVAGWLHRVAVRAALAARREDKARSRAEREAACMLPDGAAEPTWEDIKTEVDLAIDGLPDSLRVPLVLHFLEGKSQTAIAQEFGLSQPAVSMRIKKGIGRLRRRLKQTGFVLSASGLAGLLGTHGGEAAPATLVAELGRIALAGVGSGSPQAGVAASGLGVGAILGSKGAIAYVAATCLVMAAAVQYTVRGTGSPQPPMTATRMGVGPVDGSGIRPVASRQGTASEQLAISRVRCPEKKTAVVPASFLARHTDGSEDPSARTPPRPSEQPAHQPDVSLPNEPPPPARADSSTTLVAQASEESGAGAADEHPAEVEPPTVDLTDAAAVVRAYTDACTRGDVEAALALTTLDKEMQGGVQAVVAGVKQMAGGHLPTMVSELVLLPLGVAEGYAVEGARVEGDATHVSVTLTHSQQLTFVLEEQEDGTWRVDLERSILATTRQPASLLMSEAEQQRAQAADAASGRIDWRVREALLHAGKHVIRYARETGRYPKAESWMDDVEAHCMVLGAFDVSDVLPEKYGLAMNAGISGLPYDENWPARRKIVGLFTSSDTSRNASADPDLELSATDEGIEGIGMWLASEEVVTVPHGMSVDEVVLSVDDQEVSRRRVEAILQALLSYARDNGAKLPPADSWCDMVLLYAPAGQEAEELFWCPATPQLDCAWAINQDLAGQDIRHVPDHDQQVLLFPAEAGDRDEARAVPAVVEHGRYLAPWSEGPRLAVRVGMLNGETRLLCEGDAYPRPPTTGAGGAGQGQAAEQGREE